MQQDFAALQWVTDEIDQTADQFGKSLLGYADNVSDETRLRLALTQAHQLHATLRVLGVKSAEQLASEVEETVQFMLHGKIAASETNLQLLLAASMQLPGYLRRVAADRRESPLDVFAAINELRSARGAPPLAPPSVDEVIDVRELGSGIGADAASASDDDLQLLRRARQHFQLELLGLLKGEEAADKLQQLQKIFALLGQRLRRSGHSLFWQAAAAVCDALLRGGVAMDDKARDTLRDLDRELRANLALESAFYTKAPDAALYRRMLQLIAQSKPASPLLVEIQQRHRLFPDVAGGVRANKTLDDLGATTTVVEALGDDLSQVLERLESSDGEAFGIGRVLREVEPELRRIANVMAGLGYRAEHEILLPQLQHITSGVLSGADGDDQLTGITAALLDVDQRLATRAIESGGDSARAESRRHPLQRARSALLREVQAGLELIKQSVNDYASSVRDVQILSANGNRLHALGGALRMAEMDAAAAVLQQCRAYLDEVVSEARPAPDSSEVESFADAISSVEYFVERLAIDQTPAELLLVRAQAALKQLQSTAPRSLHVIRVQPAVIAVDLPPLADEQQLEHGDSAVLVDAHVAEPAQDVAAERQAQPAVELLSAQPQPEPESVSLPETESEPVVEPQSEAELLDPEIIEIFVEEAAEVLDVIETQFPAWRQNPASSAPLTEMRRAFHTLKGSGRMVGAEIIGDLAWSIENLLNRVLERSLDGGPDVVEALDRARQMMPALVAAFATRGSADVAAVRRLQQAAQAVARKEAVVWAEVAASADQPAAASDDLRVALQSEASVAVAEVVEAEFRAAPEPAVAERQLSSETLALTEPPTVAEAVASDQETPTPDFGEFDMSAEDQAHESAQAISGDVEQPVAAFMAAQPEPEVQIQPAAVVEIERQSLPAVEPEEDVLDPEIVEIFVEEAAEVLQAIAVQLPAWRAAPAVGTPLTEMRRAFHTLKGSGRMVGAETLADLAWSIENLLNRLLERSLDASADIVEAVDRATHMMPALVAAFAARGEVDLSAVHWLQEAANALARKEPVSWAPASMQATHTEQSVQTEVVVARQPEPETILQPAAEPLESELEQAREPVLTATEITLEVESQPAAQTQAVAFVDLPVEAVQHLIESVAPGPEAPEAESELPQLAEEAPATLPGEEPARELSQQPEYRDSLEDWAPELSNLDVLELSQPASQSIAFDTQDAKIVSAVTQLTDDWLPELEPEELARAVEIEQAAQTSKQPPDDVQWVEETAAPAIVEPVVPPSEPIESMTTAPEPDTQLLEVFADEVADHLQRIGDFLAQTTDRVATAALKRSLHTLKGSAHIAEVQALAWVAEPLEDLVAERGELPLSRPELALLQDFCDLLQDYLLQVAEGRADWIARADDLATRCRAALTQWMSSQARTAASSNDGRLLRFLEAALEKLFHVTSVLDSWRSGGATPASRAAVAEELLAIHGRAEQLGVQSVLLLSGPLSRVLDSAQRSDDGVSSPMIDTVKAAVDAFLDVLDRLAAGQVPEVPPDIIERLQNMTAELQSAALAQPIKPVSAAPPVVADVELVRARVGRDLAQAEHELLDIFMEEAEELLVAIDETIDTWRHQPAARAPFDDLQRHLHTLKGGARMAGLRYLGDLSHNFETFLINQNVHFGSFDDGFFVRIADYQEQLLRTMDVVRERPAPPVEAVDVVQSAVEESGTAPDVTITPVDVPLDAAPDAAVTPDMDVPLAAAAELVLPVELVPASIPASVPEEEAVSEQELAKAEDDAAQAAEQVHAAIIADVAQADLELLGIFMEEAEELMVSIDHAIEAWRADRSSRAPCDDLQRHLHTLKGGARMAGIRHLGNLSHDFETYLIEQDRGAGFGDAFFKRVADYHEQLLRTMDWVREKPAAQPVAASVAPVAAALAATATEPAPQPRQVEVLQPLAEIPLPVAPMAPQLPATTVSFTAAARRTTDAPPPQSAAAAKPREREEVVRVSAQLLEELVNLAGETSISRGRVEEQVNELGGLFGDMQGAIERLQGQVRRLDIATEAQVLFRRERAEGTGPDGFDPLEMDRYSQLQQLSRSLVESASDLLDIKRTLAEKTRDLETVLIQQSRINSQLQEGLMRSRMVPFASILPRLKRIVRQVSGELDKKVELELGNIAGDLDRGILERVVAPLEHMLRNAVDHGIESSERRRAAGKSETGRILIEIAREGGDVLIAISDDGGGVNLEAVRKKAIERGLMQADSLLSDHEVVQFILNAGFSTATKVTQISGRGVGMDVVCSEIRNMGGSLEIQTNPGFGSRFIIRLPFTVSVSRALLVGVGAEIYAMPLNTVEGVVRMRTDELARYSGPEASPFQYAGQQYQVRYLGSLLYPGDELDLGTLSNTVPVVLVRGGGQTLAVEVDRLLGASEIVVKSLGPQFGTVPGLSGATVLGDGSVVVILDIPAMLRADVANMSLGHEVAVQAVTEAKPDSPPLIMVVDDSVTVRKVTTRFLERQGMRVITAKDGADAMAQLQEQVPDLMLLDIEMPHMDGFEVVSKVRLSEQLRHLPIIMITSRTGDKHRERALSLGANMYLGKPYQESVLMDHINTLLQRKRD